MIAATGNKHHCAAFRNGTGNTWLRDAVARAVGRLWFDASSFRACDCAARGYSVSPPLPNLRLQGFGRRADATEPCAPTHLCA